jgi:hypothetical protein
MIKNRARNDGVDIWVGQVSILTKMHVRVSLRTKGRNLARIELEGAFPCAGAFKLLPKQ